MGREIIREKEVREMGRETGAMGRGERAERKLNAEEQSD